MWPQARDPPIAWRAPVRIDGAGPYSRRATYDEWDEVVNIAEAVAHSIGAPDDDLIRVSNVVGQTVVEKGDVVRAGDKGMAEPVHRALVKIGDELNRLLKARNDAPLVDALGSIVATDPPPNIVQSPE